MNLLFFGSDELLARVDREMSGQTWNIFRAEDPDQALDCANTHSFQAALLGLCEDVQTVRAVARIAKRILQIPVAIGLASQQHALRFCEKSQPDLDIVVSECGNDRLTKQQCDAIVRLANGLPTENITCGGVSFDISHDKFSINEREIHLPPKKHKLLELLFLKHGRTVTKEMVLNHLYGWEEPPESKIVDVFVCQIRRTLREAGLKQECIQTVWGLGYRVSRSLTLQTQRVA